jgi:hypothetical protein
MFFSRVEKPSDDLKSCLFLMKKKGLSVCNNNRRKGRMSFSFPHLRPNS